MLGVMAFSSFLTIYCPYDWWFLALFYIFKFSSHVVCTWLSSVAFAGGVEWVTNNSFALVSRFKMAGYCKLTFRKNGFCTFFGSLPIRLANPIPSRLPAMLLTITHQFWLEFFLKNIWRQCFITCRNCPTFHYCDWRPDCLNSDWYATILVWLFTRVKTLSKIIFINASLLITRAVC